MNWGLPVSVEIGGVSYEIRTDFRVILDIFVMLSDPDLSGTDRAEGILQMFYVSPEDKKDIIKAHAEAHSESVNGFINRAIDEAIERDESAPAASEGHL